jgi:ABC-2 type transport system permease protein
MNSLRLYFRFVGASLRGQMQYRASTLMAAVGMFLVTVIEIVGIWAMFQRFGSLKQWRLPHVALFYAMITIAFSMSEMVARGFDIFPGMIKNGTFDRILLRPRSATFQVAAQQFQLMRLGRLLQGVIVLAWAATTPEVTLDLPRVGVLLLAIGGGCCLFYGLFVLYATVSFWTVESLELFACVTYGGCETGQYPLTIYRPWFRKFFTFIVPLAAITYFPALAILGKPDEVLGSPRWFQCVAPLIGVVFLVACLQIWRIGVRHYQSTGS